MLNIIKNTINRVFASGVDSDASAFITATGLSGTTQKSAITTLVKDLKSSGLWSKMKAVYPMVTDQRNIFSYTEDFTNAAWNKFNISISLNSVTAPNGALTGSTLTDNTTNGFHYIGTAATAFGQNGNNTVSIYAKANTLNWIVLYIFDGTTSNPTYFNLSNGTVGTNTAGNIASIVDAGNGWYRCSVTRNYNGTALNSNCGFILANADGVNSYAGTGKSLYVWGSQFEYGSTASTYQPILTTPAAFMASQMKYNLKDARDLDAAFRLTWSGGWTYSATGATPNGTNAYANPYLNLNIISSGLAHISYYSRTNTNVGYEWGSIDGWPTTSLVARASGGTQTSFDGQAYSVYANADGTGLYLGQKNSSTENSGYKNGTKVLSKTGTVSYASGKNVYLARYETTYGNKQCGFASLGELLSDQENLLLNQIVEKYQVALSRGVQAAQSFYYNSAYSNESNTYLYSTQITGTTQVSAINTLINGLKANNLWTKMKAVYPFVTDYRNLLSYTEDFSNVYWTKVGSTITANTVIAPNGTLTADTLQEDTANTEHNIRTTLNGLSPNETYTYSKYVKYNNRRYMLITVYYNGGIYPVYYARFDILNGVFVSQFSGSGATIINSSITADNNGWYRITVSGQLGAFSNNIVVQTNLLDDSLAQIYLGTSKSAYIWGAQFEIGSTATAYQPVLAANSSSSFMSAQMKFNLVNPQDTDAAFRLAFSGGWTYSTNGAQPNGTNGYADTKLVGNTNVVKGDFGFGIYSRTNVNNNGAFGIDTSLHIYPRFTDNNTYYRLFNGGVGINNGSSLGFIHGYNNASFVSTSWYNNNKVNTTNTSTFNIASTNLMLGGNVPGVGGYDSRQLAFAFASQSLNDAEVALLYQLVTEYQTTLSRNV